MIDEMSLTVYLVGNLSAAGAMMLGSKLRGQERYMELIQMLKDYRLFAVLLGIVMAAIGALGKETAITGFANQVDLVAFRPVADRIFWRAQIAVYGPLMVTTQQFAQWGKIVALCICVVWLPCVIAAAATGLPELIVIGDTLYIVVHSLF